MHNKILSHKQYIKEKLADESLDSGDYRRLYEYHCNRVSDFQHERLIHLLVTFFFCGLTVVVLGAVLFLTDVALLPYLLALLLIFAVLDCAYVWHYYHLENGVQSLYQLTDELFNKTNHRN